ncbi:MAG: hypothetical protein J6W76_07750, partial [Spirochaetales bacterium]|nr:hypothetical protein [Spirochaetales bacterium]
MAWSYNIDTNQLTESKGWFQVGICTKDEAGNETQQKFDDPSYMLIDQDADMPRNNFNFDKDATINVKGTVSGIAFDDDGVTHVYIAAVLSEEAEQFLNNNPVPSEWTSVRTETRVICIETASDTNSGSSIINWGFEVPVKGGNYIIYTIPVDNSGRWQENFTDMEYDGTYWTTFRVNCAADPVIVLDKQVDSDVIDDELYKNNGYWISGNFYDNEGIKSISAAIVQYNNDDLSGDNIVTKVIYTAENEANLEETFRITKTDTTSLSTGQTVPRKYFSWRFDPSLFGKTMAFTQMKIKFTAIDDDYTDGSDGHYNEASIVLYGDTVRPNFSDVSPANNSTLTTDTTFDGWVWDNVGVTSLVMTGDNFTARQFSKDSESAIIGEPEWDANAKKYKRYFRTTVTPADINYQATTITLTANDAVGNESTYTINIRQDSTAPIVEFDNPTPGSYLNADGTITVKIIPHLIGGVLRNVKAVSFYVGTNKQNDISISDFEQSTNIPYAYTATFGVSAGEHSLDLSDGDTNIKVEATDVAGNKGEGTLYFIVDTTSPTNLEVTSPELLDSATVSILTDNTADITMEDISYYLNNSVTFK